MQNQIVIAGPILYDILNYMWHYGNQKDKI